MHGLRTLIFDVADLAGAKRFYAEVLGKTRLEHTWVVVELDVEKDGTRVRVTHAGWPASSLAGEPHPRRGR